MTYRRAPCHHCGARSAATRCRDCDQHLCELCAVDGRCPSCWRARLAAFGSPGNRRWRKPLLLAAGLLTAAGIGWVTVQAHHRTRVSLGSTTRAQLRAVQQALAVYTLENDDCPNGLGALYSRNYLAQGFLTDPWGEPFDYQCLQRNRGRGIRLSSSGPDQERDTADDIRLDHEIRW